MTTPLDILAFGAHPDDVELFCGGLLAAASAAGHRVGVVDLTRGERASAGTPAERDAEARAAAEVLGLAHRECLGLPDTGIDPDDGVAVAGRPESQLGRAVACLRRLRPELVVIPHTEARHPDHAAAGLLLRRAVFYANVRNFDAGTPDPPHRPRQVLVWPERVEVEPTFVVDVSAVIERKRAAIRSHRSQVERPPGATEGTLVSSPQMMEYLDARDRLAGARLGVPYGEPYLLDGTIGLVDPLDHFRRNPFERPHVLPRR